MRPSKLLPLLATLGCVEPSNVDELDTCEGKCDGAAQTLSPGLSKLFASPAFFDQIEKLDSDATRQYRLGAVHDDGDAITIDVWSSPTLQFPASEAIAGQIEATGASVQFVAGDEARGGDELPVPLGLVLADARYAKAARAYPATAVRDVIVDGDTVVVDVGAAEIVGRVQERVERPATVDSVKAWPQGVIVDETVFALPETSFFPGNGYFAFDDRDAFRTKFWAPFAGNAPAPYIGRDERVVGFVVSYTPYAGKSMKIDRVRTTAAGTEVDVMLRWDAFGCFEAIDDVQLVDVIKVPKTNAPIKVNVWSQTGPGCNTGTMLPPPAPPRLEHALVLHGDARDTFLVCAAPGNFSAPFTSCAPRDTLR